MELYYINAKGRSGPLNADQLRALSLQGVITQDTIIEAGGKTFPARKVKGLEFADSTQKPPVLVPPAEPEPDFLVSSDWSKHIFESIAVLPENEPNAEQKASENRRRARIDAAESLDTCCEIIGFFAWINLFVCMIVGITLLANAEMDGDTYDTTIIADGIASIVGGIVGVIVHSFLSALCRYIIARDNDK